MRKLSIILLSTVMATVSLSANEFGFKIGYMDIQQGRFDSDLEQRFILDETIRGSGANYQFGYAYSPFRSDASFMYPAQIYFTPGDWPGDIRIELDYWSFNKTSLDGEGVGINALTQTSFDHRRTQGSAKIAAYLIREGRKGGTFDLILRAGGVWDNQFYSEQTTRVFSNSALSLVNYIGARETKIFLPILGLEARVPIGNNFSVFAGFEASSKKYDQLDYLQVDYNNLNNNPIGATAEQTAIDVGMLRNRYEAGFAYNVTEDFLLRVSYVWNVNQISYSSYAGLSGTFGGTVASPQFTLNQAEMIHDAFFVYSGTKTETIEGVMFGIEKFFNW